MTINSVTHAGVTYTRTGRKYTHAVLTTVQAYISEGGTPVDAHTNIEWASSLELAQKNAVAKGTRTAKAKRGEPVRGMWGVEYMLNTVAIDIVEVDHPVA